MEKMTKLLKALVLMTILSMFLGCASTAKSLATESEGDIRITREVAAAFFHEPALRTSQIGIQTRNGVVSLTGVVERSRHVQLATQLAGGVKGVVEVKTELSVKE